jgi:hypothetical protein
MYQWFLGDSCSAAKCARRLHAIVLVSCTAVLAACVPAKPPAAESFVETAPPMRWDHRPEAREWTQSTLLAVSAKDPVLASRVPADIEAWCPGYASASVPERRAFWVGVLSSLAKYESTWNPSAAGGGGRWIGLMQISPRSAVGNGCVAQSASALKNGSANLACAVEFMARTVGEDGVVAGRGNRGLGRDWTPMRNGSKRAEMAAWTSAQPYCQPDG